KKNFHLKFNFEKFSCEFFYKKCPLLITLVKIMKSRATGILASVYIVLYISIATFFLSHNYILFPCRFTDYKSRIMTRIPLKNNMSQDLSIQYHNRNKTDNTVYFNCHGQQADDIEKILRRKFLDSNVYFLFHRGHESGQIIRNKKVIAADIEAVADYIMTKTPKTSTITVSGHSLGTWSAVRCAQYIFKKGRECKIKLLDPFTSIKYQVSCLFPLVDLLFIYDYCNFDGMKALKDHLWVYRAEIENVLHEKEAKRMADFLKENGIRTRVITGTFHTNSIFVHDDFFALEN
ncbi:hypothetical protein M153_108870003, partial [Pseudoloma neurophilia]